MNIDSEQLKIDMSVTMAQDQPLDANGLFNALGKWLGIHNLKKQKILGRNVIVYEANNKCFILLTKAITYLGNPHPTYKKRIQLPDWYQTFYNEVQNQNLPYDIRFIGIYRFNDNVIFADFNKDSYLKHGLHNSSAHVYINDLYQGMVYGVFTKTDKFGNVINVVRNHNLKEYLNRGNQFYNDNLFELFKKFNCGFTFGQWLYAVDIIKEMHSDKWHQWKQAEWAGWFLEYRFDKFIRENNLQNVIQYTGSCNKCDGLPDFDLHFVEEDFYGDLKASDLRRNETPGNDQTNLVECIYRYRKFWYIIYEHDTIKDSGPEYRATKERNQFIRSIDIKYEKDDMSYYSRMKHSVNFKKMSIIELNAVNYRNALKAFNQGCQPDGSPRNPKFMITKKILNDDNYVVFRYEYPFNHEKI